MHRCLINIHIYIDKFFVSYTDNIINTAVANSFNLWKPHVAVHFGWIAMSLFLNSRNIGSLFHRRRYDCSLLHIWRNVFVVVDLSVVREWRWNRSKWARADIFLGGSSQSSLMTSLKPLLLFRLLETSSGSVICTTLNRIYLRYFSS